MVHQCITYNLYNFIGEAEDWRIEGGKNEPDLDLPDRDTQCETRPH